MKNVKIQNGFTVNKFHEKISCTWRKNVFLTTTFFVSRFLACSLERSGIRKE